MDYLFTCYVWLISSTKITSFAPVLEVGFGFNMVVSIFKQLRGQAITEMQRSAEKHIKQALMSEELLDKDDVTTVRLNEVLTDKTNELKVLSNNAAKRSIAIASGSMLLLVVSGFYNEFILPNIVIVLVITVLLGHFPWFKYKIHTRINVYKQYFETECINAKQAAKDGNKSATPKIPENSSN